MGKTTRVALYVRVSTSDQNCEGQEAELRQYAKDRGWEIAQVYRDKMSGAKNSRPALDALMADARRHKFAIAVVWKFDRFARSVSHLLHALETFSALGIAFVSLSEQIDTTTPTGKMVFTVLGAVAELERSLIGERVRMGIQNARRKGVRLGRPAIKTLDAAESARIRAERANGATLREIARSHRTSVWSVFNVCSA
jgi:DNA invertase Pin-like site-specific DNA recombinase